METKQKEVISVFTSSVARQLLHLGYVIVDIKPNRRCEEEQTIYLFKNQDGLIDDITKLVREKKSRKAY